MSSASSSLEPARKKRAPLDRQPARRWAMACLHLCSSQHLKDVLEGVGDTPHPSGAGDSGDWHLALKSDLYSRGERLHDDVLLIIEALLLCEREREALNVVADLESEPRAHRVVAVDEGWDLMTPREIAHAEIDADGAEEVEFWSVELAPGAEPGAYEEVRDQADRAQHALERRQDEEGMDDDDPVYYFACPADSKLLREDCPASESEDEGDVSSGSFFFGLPEPPLFKN